MDGKQAHGEVRDGTSPGETQTEFPMGHQDAPAKRQNENGIIMKCWRRRGRRGLASLVVGVQTGTSHSGKHFGGLFQSKIHTYQQRHGNVV